MHQNTVERNIAHEWNGMLHTNKMEFFTSMRRNGSKCCRYMKWNTMLCIMKWNVAHQRNGILQINEMYADYKFNAVAHKFNELKQNVVIPWDRKQEFSYSIQDGTSLLEGRMHAEG